MLQESRLEVQRELDIWQSRHSPVKSHWSVANDSVMPRCAKCQTMSPICSRGKAKPVCSSASRAKQVTTNWLSRKTSVLLWLHDSVVSLQSKFLVDFDGANLANLMLLDTSNYICLSYILDNLALGKDRYLEKFVLFQLEETHPAVFFRKSRTFYFSVGLLCITSSALQPRSFCIDPRQCGWEWHGSVRAL